MAHDGTRRRPRWRKTKHFDAIVSDIAMPDMDGLALLRAIRETDLDVPMIFMTGSPALETAMEAIEYGAFRYLVKPVPPDALLEVVDARGARAQAGARAARGQRWSRSWKASRSAIGPGSRRGSRRRSRSCGWPRSRSCRGRGSSTFAYETLLRTDEPTLRSPLRLLRRRRAAGAGRRAGADHPPARRGAAARGAARRATCSSTCTRPISRIRSSTPTTAR